MTPIVLTTLNARYAHASFGLRYLMANLGPLKSKAAILEFDISQRPIDIAEEILALNPTIVGIGVYIWNAELSAQLVAILKRIRPDLIVVIGGPEVSHETDKQDICRLADYTITGEADLAFADLCRDLLAGRRPLLKIISADLPHFEADRALALPYELYDDQDIRHRVIYVEASRGCPFRCEFCLSSLDVPVRNVPIDAFLHQMQMLLDRGVRQFKFVDRTFNLNLSIGRAILQFFLDRLTADLFLHFEMIPDRLPEGLRTLIAQFPPGMLQFEVGIQSFNPDVTARISRRQDNTRVEDNLRFLRNHTGVHVHADLIVGLPGETLTSFGQGFDRLLALGPQEIQVGILKRLRGAPIARHDAQWQMVYSDHPPYEVLATGAMSFGELQRMRRFARYWDLLGNSGNFSQTLPLLWGDGSAFEGFITFADWLFDRLGRRTHGIALHKLAEHLFTYLTQMPSSDKNTIGRTLAEDFARNGREIPDFLRPFAGSIVARPRIRRAGLVRQSQHTTTVDSAQ